MSNFLIQKKRFIQKNRYTAKSLYPRHTGIQASTSYDAVLFIKRHPSIQKSYPKMFHNILLLRYARYWCDRSTKTHGNLHCRNCGFVVYRPRSQKTPRTFLDCRSFFHP